MGGWMVGGREGKKEERRIKGKGRKKEGRRRIFVVFSPLLFFFIFIIPNKTVNK